MTDQIIIELWQAYICSLKVDYLIKAKQIYTTNQGETNEFGYISSGLPSVSVKSLRKDESHTNAQWPESHQPIGIPTAALHFVFFVKTAKLNQNLRATKNSVYIKIQNELKIIYQTRSLR